MRVKRKDGSLMPVEGRWTVVRAKPAGVSPGFVLRDSKRVLWFVQFDAPKYPEAASAASMASPVRPWGAAMSAAAERLMTRCMSRCARRAASAARLFASHIRACALRK